MDRSRWPGTPPWAPGCCWRWCRWCVGAGCRAPPRTSAPGPGWAGPPVSAAHKHHYLVMIRVSNAAQYSGCCSSVVVVFIDFVCIFLKYLSKKLWTSSNIAAGCCCPHLTDAVHPLDDLVLGGVAGQPGVDVGDDVDADGAEEVIPGHHTCPGSRHAQQQGQEHGHCGLEAGHRSETWIYFSLQYLHHSLQRYMSTVYCLEWCPNCPYELKIVGKKTVDRIINNKEEHHYVIFHVRQELRHVLEKKLVDKGCPINN